MKRFFFVLGLIAALFISFDADALRRSPHSYHDPLKIYTPTAALAGQARLGDIAGVNSHDMNGADLAAMNAVGYHWVRTGDLWQADETSLGTYSGDANWTAELAALNSHAMRPIWLLAYGNPLYGCSTTFTGTRSSTSSPNVTGITGINSSNANDLPIGATITGTGVPASTTISSITSATAIVMSKNASATGTGVITVTGCNSGTTFSVYPCDASSCWTGFKNWAVHLVGLLPPGQVWEIWNEEDVFPLSISNNSETAWGNLLKTVIPAIQAADPTAIVLTGGEGWVDQADLGNALVVGGFTPNGFGYHAYPYTGSSGTVTLDAEGNLDVANFNYLGPWYTAITTAGFLSMTPRGVNTTWITEGGYCLTDGPTTPISQATWQALMTVRFHLAHWIMGVPLEVQYDSTDGCWSMTDTTNNNPMIVAVTFLMNKIANGRVLTHYGIPNPVTTGMWAARMEGSADVVYALWLRYASSPTNTVTINVPPNTLMYNMAGTPSKTGTSVTVSAQAGPIYLVFPK